MCSGHNENEREWKRDSDGDRTCTVKQLTERELSKAFTEIFEWVLRESLTPCGLCVDDVWIVDAVQCNFVETTRSGKSGASASVQL